MTGKDNEPRSDKTLDENMVADKEELKAREMTELEYCNLIPSMSEMTAGNVELEYIRNSKTDALPAGDVKRAWHALES
jgi:hypothetical protein